MEHSLCRSRMAFDVAALPGARAQTRGPGRLRHTLCRNYIRAAQAVASSTLPLLDQAGTSRLPISGTSDRSGAVLE